MEHYDYESIRDEVLSDSKTSFGDTETSPSSSPEALVEKRKKNGHFGRKVAALALAGTLGVSAVTYGLFGDRIKESWANRHAKGGEDDIQASDVIDNQDQNQALQSSEGGVVLSQTPTDLENDAQDITDGTEVVISSRIEQTVVQKPGELSNGTKYDYSHYADVKNKVGGTYAFDYDMTDCWVDEVNEDGSYTFNGVKSKELTIKGILGVAELTPEALSAYTSAFYESEKQELGIASMTQTEIDDYMSNAKNLDGGALQAKIFDKLKDVLNDGTTGFNFYIENDVENSNYIYFVDKNGDGIMTPDEMHLGASTRKRNNAKQVDILRPDENNPKEYRTYLDLNMVCGFQPNYAIGQLPKDIPIIDTSTTLPDPVTPEKPAENEPEKPVETTTPSGEGGGRDPEPPAETTPSTPSKPYTPVEQVIRPKSVALEVQNAGPRAEKQEVKAEEKTAAPTSQTYEDLQKAQEALDQQAAEAARIKAEQEAKEQAAAAEAAARRAEEAAIKAREEADAQSEDQEKAAAAQAAIAAREAADTAVNQAYTGASSEVAATAADTAAVVEEQTSAANNQASANASAAAAEETAAATADLSAADRASQPY